MRLINANNLKNNIKALLNDPDTVQMISSNDVLDVINEEPTVDAEPLKHAHWVWDENGYDWGLPAWVCSACNGRNNNIPPYINGSRVTNPYLWSGAQYCPICGAKMTKEKESNVPEVH